jgi:3-oxoacyl-[acyl-carrier protein] reductase
MNRLAEHVAIVTGVGDDLSTQVVAALAREGAAVVVHAWTHDGVTDRLIHEIESSGGKAIAARGDLAQPNDAAAVVSAATGAFGRVDILVNHSQVPRDGAVLALTDQDWHAGVQTGLLGTFLCIRAALREFVRQRRGRIINVTAVPLLGTVAGQSSYVTARAGVIGLTRAVAREVGSRGITVNAVAPGLIDGTPAADPALAPRALGLIPLGRKGAPADVAAAVVFLASDEAGYITGQVLHVDGGMVMH